MDEMSIEQWFKKDWPMKFFEGGVRLERTAAGNPEVRWTATLIICIYPPGGWADIQSCYAQGPTPQVAFEELWGKAIDKMKQMRDDGKLHPMLDDWMVRHKKELQ